MKRYCIPLLFAVSLLIVLMSMQSNFPAWTANEDQESHEPNQVERNLATGSVTLCEYAKSKGLIHIGKQQEEEAKVSERYQETPVALYTGTNSQVIQLLHGLNDSSAKKRSKSLDDLLSQNILIDEKLEPLLVHYLQNDPSPWVRSSVTRTLEDGETPGTIDALIDALEETDVSVRENARGTLGLIRGPVVRFKLKERLSNHDNRGNHEIITQILEDFLMSPSGLTNSRIGQPSQWRLL